MHKSVQKLREKKYPLHKMQVEVSRNNTHEYKLTWKKSRKFVQWLGSHCARELVFDLDARRRKGKTIFPVDFR